MYFEIVVKFVINEMLCFACYSNWDDNSEQIYYSTIKRLQLRKNNLRYVVGVLPKHL